MSKDKNEFVFPIETQMVAWMMSWAQAIRSEHEREITEEEYERIQDAARDKYATHKEESDNNE